MVPAAFVRLEALPLTPNGKLDRKALPAPEGDAYAARAYEPPQGEDESCLAPRYGRTCSGRPVGRHDNFFELGGTLAARGAGDLGRMRERLAWHCRWRRSSRGLPWPSWRRRWPRFKADRGAVCR